MSEEEIFEIVKKEIVNTYAEGKAKALQGLLDLYNKEKSNTNKLIRYIALKENKDYEKVKEEFEIGG